MVWDSGDQALAIQAKQGRRNVKKHEKEEIDIIREFFNKIESVFKATSDATGIKVEQPKDIPKKWLVKDADRILKQAKTTTKLYSALFMLKDDIRFVTNLIKKFKNMSDKKIREMQEKYKKFFSDFYEYMEYWEYLKVKGSLPKKFLIFGNDLSRFNDKTPKHVERTLFKDVKITADSMSRLLHNAEKFMMQRVRTQ